MCRTFLSAMRIGCVVAMMVFLAAPMAGAGTGAKATVMKASKPQVNSTMSSESVSSPTKSQAMVTVQPTYQRLDRLIGKRVLDNRGRRIGTIEDVVLDSHDDSVSYAVLSCGGFLGLGDRFFAVPWSEFQARPGQDAYVLNVRKEYLKDAPGFSKKHWPNMADQTWAQDIRTSYEQGRQMSGQTCSAMSPKGAMMTKAEGALPIRCRRVTKLIGFSAKDFQGQKLGDLDDIVIDSHTNKIIYGVVILNTTPWALNRKLALVPWNVVDVVPELRALRVDADKSMLEAVAFTRGKGFPYLGNPLYAQGLKRQFGATPYWETLGYVPGEGPAAEEMKPGKPAKSPDVSAWRPGSEYNKQFDPSLVTTVRGTIQSIGVFSVVRSSVKGLRLDIRTPEGKTWTVYAGPRPFIDSQDIALHYGDNVIITGAPTRVAAWRGEVLIAATIEDGGKTCRLRDANGTPQWDADKLVGLGSSKQ